MTKDSQGLEIGFKKLLSLVGALTKKGGSMMNNGVCGVTKITKSFSYGENSQKLDFRNCAFHIFFTTLHWAAPFTQNVPKCHYMSAAFEGHCIYD